MTSLEMKRLFFGFDIQSCWPQNFPKGRVLEENARHLTLAFLGETDFSKMQTSLLNVPSPTFKVAKVGIFDKCLFLPKTHPNVVSWHISWLKAKNEMINYQKKLVSWLKNEGFLVDHEDRDFLPHVTICRKPFVYEEWKKGFIPLPMKIDKIHLYESLGHSQYASLWEKAFIPAFEEIEHTADLAFGIYAEDLNQLFINAQSALFFTFPDLTPYYLEKEVSSLEEVIFSLNEMVTIADTKIGAPIKAVSYSGKLMKQPNDILYWEMLLDV